MLTEVLIPALGETLYMVLVSTALAVLIGFFPAIIMIITDKNGLKPNEPVYKTLDVIINIFRSFPFFHS